MGRGIEVENTERAADVLEKETTLEVICYSPDVE